MHSPKPSILACWRHDIKRRHQQHLCLGGGTATRNPRAHADIPYMRSLLPLSKVCLGPAAVAAAAAQRCAAAANKCTNPVRQDLGQNSGASQPPQSLEQMTDNLETGGTLVANRQLLSCNNAESLLKPLVLTTAKHRHCTQPQQRASPQHASERAAGREKHPALSACLPCTHISLPNPPVHAYLQTARTSHTPASTATINNLCRPQ